MPRSSWPGRIGQTLTKIMHIRDVAHSEHHLDLVFEEVWDDPLSGMNALPPELKEVARIAFKAGFRKVVAVRKEGWNGQVAFKMGRFVSTRD